MIKGIIFDLDGLLVDTEKMSLSIYQELLAPYNRQLDHDEYVRLFCGKTEKANIAYMIANYDLPWSQDEGIKLVAQKEEEYIKRGIDLKKGAKELLCYLKQNGYKIALASSSTKERAFSLLRQQGILAFFDTFVLAEDVSNSKPDPEVFLKALAKLKLTNEEALVLEDSENGVLAGHRAKIKVLCIPDMKLPAKDILTLATKTYSTLLDVIDYLEENNN